MRKFIAVTAIGTKTGTLLRKSAIVSVVQEPENLHRRTIQYVVGDRVDVLRVLETTEEILRALEEATNDV